MSSNVVYRDIDHSPALTDTIHKKLAKLSRFSNNIQHSRVVLDAPHNHKHKGKLYRASIELDIKGKPVVIHRDDSSIHTAVRDAFNVAERKLKQISSPRYDREGIKDLEENDLDFVEQELAS